jgi:hypothetical protein
VAIQLRGTGRNKDTNYREFKYMLHQLPIRRITSTTPPPDRKRLKTKARALSESSMAAKTPAILDFTETELATNHADVIHDFLAYLAEQMMELNQAKQTRVHLDTVLNLTARLHSNLGCGGRLRAPSVGGALVRSRTGRHV